MLITLIESVHVAYMYWNITLHSINMYNYYANTNNNVIKEVQLLANLIGSLRSV